MTNHNRTNRTRTIAIVAVCLLIATAWITLRNSPGPRFGRVYQQITLGMSKTQVQNLFDREPDFECRLGSSDIWYIRAPDSLAEDFFVKADRAKAGIPSGSTVKSTSELPDMYDHVQLAFDSNDRLHAFTWIGETHTVESTNGSMPGSHFKVLAESTFMDD